MNLFATLFFVLNVCNLIQSISIPCQIVEIKKKNVQDKLEEVKSGSLKNYWIGYDKFEKKAYVTTEIHADNLDSGADPTDLSKQWIQEVGADGDKAGQVLGKKLGGSGDEVNVFPLDGKANTVALNGHEDEVYKFLKQGQNRYARLFFAFEYEESSSHHPSKLYYYFVLYENNKRAQKLKGQLDNPKN